MKTTETTNGLLDQVIKHIQTLIEWADADAQHASENDARWTSRDDFRRGTTLRKALKLIEECKR